jgi:hypothetical protein
MTMEITFIVAICVLHAEPEFFYVHEYPIYLDEVDDILDVLDLDFVNQIYEVRALEASPTPQD